MSDDSARGARPPALAWTLCTARDQGGEAPPADALDRSLPLAPRQGKVADRMSRPVPRGRSRGDADSDRPGRAKRPRLQQVAGRTVASVTNAAGPAPPRRATSLRGIAARREATRRQLGPSDTPGPRAARHQRDRRTLQESCIPRRRSKSPGCKRGRRLPRWPRSIRASFSDGAEGIASAGRAPVAQGANSLDAPPRRSRRPVPSPRTARPPPNGAEGLNTYSCTSDRAPNTDRDLRDFRVDSGETRPRERRGHSRFEAEAVGHRESGQAELLTRSRVRASSTQVQG